MMTMSAPWGVLRVKVDIGDAILCVQKLNLVVAVTLGDPHEVQDADAFSFSGEGEYPGGSRSASPSRRISKRIQK